MRLWWWCCGVSGGGLWGCGVLGPGVWVYGLQMEAQRLCLSVVTFTLWLRTLVFESMFRGPKPHTSQPHLPQPHTAQPHTPQPQRAQPDWQCPRHHTTTLPAPHNLTLHKTPHPETPHIPRTPPPMAKRPTPPLPPAPRPPLPPPTTTTVPQSIPPCMDTVQAPLPSTKFKRTIGGCSSRGAGGGGTRVLRYVPKH